MLVRGCIEGKEQSAFSSDPGPKWKVDSDV